VTGDLGPAAADRDVYARLIAELDASGCRYRLIEHAPEGRTEAVRALLGASYVAFADTGKAEQLAGSVTGTVLPFSYDERLELIADPALLDCGELYFNAGRLDRSVALASEDYLRLAGPRIARIIAT
jgi:Ala-tRNA(Pro) deacylase